MTSSLPAEILWNGSGQLWLFENIFCTKESLDGEVAAFEELGWATGWIFDNLRSRGFIKPVDWAVKIAENQALGTEMKAAWDRERAAVDRVSLLAMLTMSREAELDRIKHNLLLPMMNALECVDNISPNSVKHWNRRTQQSRVGAMSAADLLARKLHSLKRFQAGALLCERPGDGLTIAERVEQERVQREVEGPMIPDLLAGQLEQASYLAELRPHADVYGPIDSRLKADFVRNIGNLERLRAEAEIHLWPHLHGEWIPRLEREPKFEKEFNRLLSNALRKARFGNLLGRSTQIAMVGVGAGLAPAMNHVGDAAAAVLSGAGVGVSIAAGRLTASQDEPTRSLVAFYQSFSTSQVASGVSPK